MEAEMSESMYVPPELANARKRAQGQKLVVFGVIVAALGCVGTLLSVVLKVVWLGILGGPIGALSGLALLAGIICLAVGFTQVKAARSQ
jgi:hypothetical protein